MSGRIAAVRAAQECAMSAGNGWRARHASGNALLGSEYIDGRASQAGLHHCQARNLLLPFRSPAPTLAEAVL